MLKLTAWGGAVFALLGVALLQNMADQLFSAHMLQHLLLIAVAAPLLALGGAQIRVPPLAGWGLFITVFIFWHWPQAFQWAAGNVISQLFELGTIFAAAVCFWTAVLGHNGLNNGARALMVMTAAILTDLPGVVMLFAPAAICVMPHESAARFGLTPLADQQLAGLLMWVPANLVFFGIATFLFARWIGSGPQSMVTS